MTKSPAPAVRATPRIAALLGTAVVLSLTGLPAATAVGPTTVVSLTFDDSVASQWSAAEALNEVNLEGTFFTVSGYVDAPGHLTRTQLNSMSASGHEIGGHTVSHSDLTTVSALDATRQVCLDRATLSSWGFEVRSFAFPYASIDAKAMQAVSDCGYTSGRGLGDLQSRFGCAGCDVSETLPPADPFYTRAADQVDFSWTLQDLQNFVINAEGVGGWVQLTFHHICDGCDSLSISPGLFRQFAGWLAERTLTHDVVVRTVGDAIGQPVKPVVNSPMAPPAGPGVNGIVNPSLETLASGGPYCWMKGGFGSNSPTFDTVSPGRTGAVAHRLAMSSYGDGDAKLLPTFDLGECSPTVVPGQSYALRAWYQSTAPTQFAVYLRNSIGTWSYWTSSEWFAASPIFREAAWQSPPVPNGYSAMSFGLNLFQNGELITDDYALYSAAGAPEPLLELTPAWPWITGVEKVGETLTANSVDWGPGEVTVDYQWLRDGAEIAGAVGTTYALTAADAGTMVTVRATGTKAGYNPSTTMSGAVGPIQAGDLEPTAPSIGGTAQVGLTLSAATDAWGPAPVTLSHQWLRDGVPIAGATGSHYTLVPDDEGAAITLTVTGERAGYNTASRTSEATGPVAEGEMTPGAPSITGSPTVGSTLAVTSGTWIPDTATLSYQWLSNGTAIAGASTTTYTMRPGDLGVVIAVKVTGINAGYADTTLTSIGIGPVSAGELTSAAPTISGTTSVGSTLAADPGVWGPSPVALSYQWLRAGVPIDGATSALYTLVAADMGAHMTVVVTGGKPGYSTASRSSAPTAPVAAGTLTQGPAVISGTAVMGGTLTVKLQCWGPGAVNFTIQWYRSGTSIAGATSGTYFLTPADVGETLHATITGSKSGYSSVTLTTPSTAIVAAGELVPGLASLVGKAQVGKTLTIVPGTWPPGTVLSYQWFVADVTVQGATGLSYTPGSAALGSIITATIRGDKPGYTSATVTTAATPAVVEGKLTPGRPSISGTPQVGNTLTVSAGNWTPATVTLSYQWLRAGVAIPGANMTNYTLVPADAGKLVSVSVTGQKAGYETATVRPPSIGLLVNRAESSSPSPGPSSSPSGAGNPADLPATGVGSLAGIVAFVGFLLFGWFALAWRRRF